MIRLVGSHLAIPASRARLCTHLMEMDAYQKGTILMSKANQPFISVGIDVGADISWMSIALPSQQLLGKPYKITHNNLHSLEKAVQTIKEAEEANSLDVDCHFIATKKSQNIITGK